MSRILLLEDDLSLVNGLPFAFKKRGFSLKAERLWEDGTYGLLVLDVALPDGSGFAFCKKVRQKGYAVWRLPTRSMNYD